MKTFLSVVFLKKKVLERTYYRIYTCVQGFKEGGFVWDGGISVIGYLNKFYLEGRKTTFSKARVLTGTEATVIHSSQDMGMFDHL